MHVRTQVLACTTALLASAALLIGSGTAAFGASAAATAPGPWSQTDFNAALSRANPGETTLTTSTVSQVGYRRSLTLAPGVGSCGAYTGPYAAPTLVGGDLYVIANDQLAKYQASNGKLLWKTPRYGNYALFSVAVSGGQVILGSYYCGSVSSSFGRIEAFSAATGKKTWAHITPEQAGLNSVLVAGGLAIGTGFSPANGGEVEAYQVSTGKLAWEQPLSCGGATTLVVGGLVLVSACNKTGTSGVLKAYNLTTGANAWNLPGSWLPQRGDQATAAGTNAFVLSNGTMDDLNPATGAIKYTLAGATNVLAVSASEVFAVCSSSQICAYDLSDGSQLWQVTNFSQLAAEAGGVLYLSDGEALNASTGALITSVWQNSPSGATSFAVGEGRIAVAVDPRVLDIYGLPGS